MEITSSLKSLDVYRKEGVKSFLDFFKGTINNISIENVNEESITIAAPDWLFMCINKLKQVNKHFYTVINTCYGIQLKNIRNQLSEKQFEQLQRNYIKKQRLKIVDPVDLKIICEVNPWDVHDICYDLMLYEMVNNDHEFLMSKKELYFIINTIDSYYYRKDNFLKIFIEKIIVYTNKPIELMFADKYRTCPIVNNRNMISKFYTESFEQMQFDCKISFIGMTVLFYCIVYPKKIKIIKNDYENITFASDSAKNKEHEEVYCIQKVKEQEKKYQQLEKILNRIKILNDILIKQRENYRNRAEQNRLKYDLLTKENDTLNIRLNEIQKNMQIVFDNKINSLENEKRELKEKNKLITEQFNELKNQNDNLNIEYKNITMQNEKNKHNVDGLNDVQEKNITLQSQPEKQKKYTLVAIVGIGVLLLWIMWQYKNSISLLSQQNRILL